MRLEAVAAARKPHPVVDRVEQSDDDTVQAPVSFTTSANTR
jgi:hypothetical protein